MENSLTPLQSSQVASGNNIANVGQAEGASATAEVQNEEAIVGGVGGASETAKVQNEEAIVGAVGQRRDEITVGLGNEEIVGSFLNNERRNVEQRQRQELNQVSTDERDRPSGNGILKGAWSEGPPLGLRQH